MSVFDARSANKCIAGALFVFATRANVDVAALVANAR